MTCLRGKMALKYFISTNIFNGMGERSIYIVCYADDAEIISEGEKYLQRLLNKFVIAARCCNMAVHKRSKMPHRQ